MNPNHLGGFDWFMLGVVVTLFVVWLVAGAIGPGGGIGE